MEIEKFNLVTKDVKSKRGRPSKSFTKLEDLIKLYSILLDIDKKIKYVKESYFQYFDGDEEIDYFVPQ